MASPFAGELDPFLLAGLLYLGAAVVVLPRAVGAPPDPTALRGSAGAVATTVVVGGAVAPVLRVSGQARVDAATASTLLNLELVATVALAAAFFHEHLGRRVVVSAAVVTLSGALLVWQPGAQVSVGACLVGAACACWGLDNCLTATIDRLRPEHVIVAKGVVAGSANVVIGLLLGHGAGADLTAVAAALVIGAAGYGLSITWWVHGARDLGAARAQIIFASAPFVGVLVAWTVLGEPVTALQLTAVGLAAAGIGLSLRTAHHHDHEHVVEEHDHEHVHPDRHHDHAHPDGFVGRHAHHHRHRRVRHAHGHVPDLHHHHSHR
jgi:drug/metabolite transporter (DMT)-like permease